ncbi:MAG: xylulokinase [Pikeienuella sp.]|uniref:xylulokinase n=1 Tax=Pikeienuella sp. TaxID=2831957 RepID=UPI00391B0C68
MEPRDLILSFDLGAGAMRGGVTGPDGASLAFAAEPSAAPPETEADPEGWWRAARRIAEALAAALKGDFERIGAVAVAGFTRTQVLLDADANPVRPAIGFADRAAAALAEEARALAPPGAPEAARLDAFHPALRLFRLARTEPEALARARAVVEPKDFLNARLTGRVATDAISSARLLAASAGGGGSILAALGLDPGLAPPALGPLDRLGPVRPGLPGAFARLAGRPVIAMAHDSWAAALGLGALRAGYGYNLTGTTEVFGVFSGAPAEAEGLLSVDWGEGAKQLGGPSLSGGDTLLWALGLLAPGEGPEAAMARLLAAPRAAAPLLFLPYLRGERTPWWDASLRGAWVGLDRTHGAGDLLRAALEGVAFLNRIVLDRAEAPTGARVSEIRFGGGGAASADWARIKAAACGRPFVRAGGPEPGLLGGALAAMTALGRHPSLAAAQAAMVREGARFEPEPEERARMDRLLPHFLAAHRALAPLGAALAGEAS